MATDKEIIKETKDNDMNSYAKIAIEAIRLISQEGVISPEEAWSSAAMKEFPKKKSAREKSCPKCAFLGLCEDGLINGIPKGNYTGSIKNKKYALDALKLLKGDRPLTEDELWTEVTKNSGKKYNQQMHVVSTLFSLKYIK